MEVKIHPLFSTANDKGRRIMANAPKDRSKTGTIHFENVDSYLDLYAHIKYYRQKAGLNQEELAHRANISRSFHSTLESRSRVRGLTMETLFNLCRALDIPPLKLFEPLP